MTDNAYVFGTYTVKQVSMIESEYFTIRFDGDFFNEDGYMLFTMAQAKTIYRSLASDLAAAVREGGPKDKALALEVLLGMVIEPVRYH